MLKEIVDNNIFLITSDRLDKATSAFYGFALYNNTLYIRSNPNNIIFPVDTPGTFVNVVVSEENIIIQQDFHCGYGLFIYQNDTFFAVSNSLYFMASKLHISKHFLSIDKNYIPLFIVASMPFRRTGYNEIFEILPQDIIYISKSERKMETLHASYPRLSIECDTQQSIQLLDRWHHKWSSVFYSIAANGYPLTFHLTGGKDSRASFSCASYTDGNKNNVNIYSHRSTLHTWGEDYEIADIISKDYGFKHSKNESVIRQAINPLDSIYLGLLAKFMQDAWQNYPFSIYSEYAFVCAGYGGEGVRGYEGGSLEGAEKRYIQYNKYQLADLVPNCIKYLKNIYADINSHFPEQMEEYQKLWYYTRMKTHFGRSTFEQMLQNEIILSPLMDPVLALLDWRKNRAADQDMIFALIYVRYLPDTLSIKFDSNKTISPGAIAKARELCNLYPYRPTQASSVNIIANHLTQASYPPHPCQGFDPEYFIKASLEYPEVKSTLTKMFNECIYKSAIEELEHLSFNPRALGKKLFNCYVLRKFSSAAY